MIPIRRRSGAARRGARRERPTVCFVCGTTDARRVASRRYKTRRDKIHSDLCGAAITRPMLRGYSRFHARARDPRSVISGTKLRKTDEAALLSSGFQLTSESTGRQFKDRIRKEGNSQNPLTPPSHRALTGRRGQTETRERTAKGSARVVAGGRGMKAGVAVGRFYTDNVQSLCMRLTGATAS